MVCFVGLFSGVPAAIGSVVAAEFDLLLVLVLALDICLVLMEIGFGHCF